MLNQFTRLQDRVLALTDQTEAMLQLDDPAVGGLAQARWQFCRALQEYELYFHNSVLGTVARRQPDRAQEASVLKAHPIAPKLREHVMRWSAVSPDDWPEYRATCLDGLPRLRERLSSERMAVAALLEVKASR